MTNTYRIFNKYIVLSIQNPKSLENNQIPNDALVTDSNALLALFGLEEKPPEDLQWSWGKIKNYLQDLEKSMWVKELGEVMQKANKGLSFSPIKSVFRSPNNGKIYLPSLYSLNIDNDQSRKFLILFIEQATWAVTKAADERFVTLLSCLMLGNKFQWELCIHYLYKLDNPNKSINEIYTMLKETFMNIEDEAEIRKQVEFHQNANERLIWAFEINDTRRGEVEKNLTEQNTYKQRLRNISEAQSINEVKEILSKLLMLNNRLLSIICQRYQELISKTYTEKEWVEAVLGDLRKRKL